MSDTTLTAEEVLESLTGHDEMAIAQHFGRTVSQFAEGNDQSGVARALIFVLKRREEGVSDDAARNAALDMTLKQVLGYFADDAEVDSEAGKGEPPSEQPPASAPSSVI